MPVFASVSTLQPEKNEGRLGHMGHGKKKDEVFGKTWKM